MYLNGLDDIDNQLITLLHKEGRMSYSALGEAVGLSRPAAKARVDELEKRGVILGYQAILDYNHVAIGEPYIIHIETTPEGFLECKQTFTSLPNVVSLMQTTGGCHLVAISLWESRKTLRDFILYVYKHVEGILNIQFHEVIDMIKGEF